MGICTFGGLAEHLGAADFMKLLDKCIASTRTGAHWSEERALSNKSGEEVRNYSYLTHLPEGFEMAAECQDLLIRCLLSERMLRFLSFNRVFNMWLLTSMRWNSRRTEKPVVCLKSHNTAESSHASTQLDVAAVPRWTSLHIFDGQHQTIAECGQCHRHGQPSQHMQPSTSKALTCAVCCAMFEYVDNLQLHIDREHAYRTCDKCGEEMTYAILIQHMHKHINSVGTKTCWHCHRIFRLKSSLKKHTDSFHLKKKNHKCEQCDKAYTKKTRLKSHIDSVP